jgi:DNA mismatch endonuclease (patch repair protein)
VTKTREQISYNMSRVKSSGSEIERVLGKALWAAGIRYRKQYKRLPGKPDYVIVRSKIAIFCDSSFWHGRNWKAAKTAIKTNHVFWISKIERNIDRDKEVNKMLKRLGWKVLRFWDFTIELYPGKCVQAVLSEIDNRASKIFI